MAEYTVRQGDCISSIAEEHGFFWQTLWDSNPDLQKQRSDPNVLLPGDIIIIPELQTKQQTVATESRTRFKKLGVPAQIKLVVEDNGVPIANKDYVFVVDGSIHEGKTDDSGLLVQPISPKAKEATLEINGLSFSFVLGAIDPVAEISGVQTRLQNLGFYDGDIDGESGELTTQAIAEFQSFAGLEASGELNDETRQKLLERQDREHEPIVDDANDSQEESAAVDDGEDDEDLSDGESPDEDEEFADAELEEIDDLDDGEGGVWQ